MLSSLAEAAGLSFKRIQFTPDLLPGDISGTHVLQEDPDTQRRHYQFLPGPLFANMVLADEINRTPPKTQAAMLEAMAQRQISAGGQTYQLPEPFFVLATQNPLEQRGPIRCPPRSWIGSRCTSRSDIPRRPRNGKSPGDSRPAHRAGSSPR